MTYYNKLARGELRGNEPYAESHADNSCAIEKSIDHNQKNIFGGKASTGVNMDISKGGGGSTGFSGTDTDHISFFKAYMSFILSSLIVQKILIVLFLLIVGYPLAFGIRWAIGKEDFDFQEQSEYTSYDYESDARQLKKASFFQKILR
ncbi:MAG: hypothetical protein LBE20_06145 [Deltaproteobacteria bacterium]|jgi:hypothetical protein|nr:hypothetical protein [Deltaproteobacteria bacterium]